MGCLIVAAIIAVVAAIGMFFALRPKTVDMQVESFGWERSIAIEQLQTVEESGWSLPAEGRVITTNQEISGYNKVFDHNDFCAWVNITFNLVAHSVVLGLGAYINEWLCKLFGYKCTLCDGPCCNSGDNVSIGELLKDKPRQSQLYSCTKAWERQCLAVVAIER
jgi:hypothetical protein